MTKQEFKEKIRLLIKQVYSNRSEAEKAAVEYDELTKFPQLKRIIIDLLSYQFDNFLSSIDWVAPRPTTFRINLKNNEYFYLIYNGRSWIAQIEGKSYYLLNLPEEEQAAMAIARILRYGSPETEDEGGEEGEEGGEDVDVDVEVDTEETEEA
tara:strand:- start:2002 stop:2460 length:459 start_codon:yes stop_codon:yes gene_type:complete